jgi:hypothetical protein
MFLFVKLPSGVVALVEHLPHHPKVGGSSSATIEGKKLKEANSKRLMGTNSLSLLSLEGLREVFYYENIL